jgi:hypothetical protein
MAGDVTNGSSQVLRYTEKAFLILSSMHRSLSTLYRLIASFLVMSILTSSVAMAAYVCPQLAPAQKTAMVMDGKPCAGRDKEKPVHCAEFQSGVQLALEHLAAPPALTPIVIAVVRPAPALFIPAVPASRWNDTLPAVGTDPPYLSTQRLRI